MNVELGSVNGDLMRVIELLHGFIRDDVVPEIIPVDVADYRHLADEPRVLLVGHRALFAVTRSASGVSVSYRHRRDPLDDEEARAVLNRVAERLGAGLG